MSLKKKNKWSVSGQAGVEYLLTLTAVLVAFAGVTAVFSSQVDRYLSLLLEIIALPL